MHMSKKKMLYFSLIALAAILITLPARADAQQEYPARPINLVTGYPGGSLDIGARTIQQALTIEKLVDKPIVIQNKGAGGGNQATAYMVEHKGSGYQIVLTSNRIILNYNLGTIETRWQDMTTISRLTADFPVWAVRADSKYKSPLDILAEVKKDVSSVNLAVSNLLSNNNFNYLLPLKEYGIDYTKARIVSLSGPGELMSQLLGGHIPVISAQMSELLPQVKAGKVRFLVVASPSRLASLPDVPTWKDVGINVVIEHWMGAFGPPDMPKVAYEYWDKKFAQMVQTKTWKESLERLDLYDAFLPRTEFVKALTKEEAAILEMLRRTGQLKK
jgi:putative tricarboxylic transport membrane protein